MERTPHIQWSTSCFADETLEQAYREESWRSARLLTAMTLIGFSVAWLAAVTVDNLFLRGTPYFEFAAGSRTLTGLFGIGFGLWMVLARPHHEHRAPKIGVYLWMAFSTMTAITVSWIYPFLETTADGRTDLLLSTCYWMSLQILGLGIALSAWRRGVVVMAAFYAISYTCLAIYWTPQLEYTQEAQIIVIIAASFFAVILSYLFARRARQRFYITRLYEEAKVTAEKAQQFTTFLLAATGHDIRQPIFALNLNASMLEDLIEERNWEEAAKLAERQSQALYGVSGLISSVLELSQLDTRRRSVEPEPLEIRTVIETVLAPIRSIAAHRRIDLRSGLSEQKEFQAMC